MMDQGLQSSALDSIIVTLNIKYQKYWHWSQWLRLYHGRPLDQNTLQLDWYFSLFSSVPPPKFCFLFLVSSRNLILHLLKFINDNFGIH
jgi:hypothetical protein